jgi:hypothetical protein
MNDPYSRVTNPERFAPLVQYTVDLLEQLESKYDVIRSEEFVVSAALGMRSFVALRAPICLTPRTVNAAQIMVGFTEFPSLAVRCGYWYSEPFPACGCDGCAATAADECDRVASLFEAVTAGGFREEVARPVVGRAWLSSEFSSNLHLRRSRRAIPRNHARALLAGRPRVAEWTSWAARPDPGIRA